MENKIKKETNPCLNQLQAANIGTVMATGDNGLTAIAVGRHCGIITTYKNVYLAEKMKDPEGKAILKWVKIESSQTVDDYVRNSIKRSTLRRNSK